MLCRDFNLYYQTFSPRQITTFSFFFSQKSYAWAPCISQVQKTALLSIFLREQHSSVYVYSKFCIFMCSVVQLESNKKPFQNQK